MDSAILQRQLEAMPYEQQLKQFRNCVRVVNYNDNVCEIVQGNDNRLTLRPVWELHIFHDTTQPQYRFVSSYSDLDYETLNSISDMLICYKDISDQYSAKELVKHSNQMTMRLIGFVFTHLLYSNSNGRHYSFNEVLSKRIDAVYASESPMTNWLVQQRDNRNRLKGQNRNNYVTV